MSLRGLAGINLITFGIDLHGYGFSTGICSLCISKSNSFIKLTSSFTFCKWSFFFPFSAKRRFMYSIFFPIKQHPYKRNALQTVWHLAESSSPSAFTDRAWTTPLPSHARLGLQSNQQYCAQVTPSFRTATSSQDWTKYRAGSSAFI